MDQAGANDGRREGAGLVLLTRAGCGLCEEMHAALEALGMHRPLPRVTLVDVDCDPLLQRRWGLKVPVLLLDGTPVCVARLDVQALVGALAEAARARRAGAAPASPTEPRR